MYSKEKKFKIADGIVISEINNESVMLNLATGNYFQVNELGSLIISALSEYSTINDLNKKIIKDFDVTTDKCKEDLLAFIKDLESKKLLHFK